MPSKNKKCRICTNYLRLDGTCTFKCDPALAQPAWRRTPDRGEPEKALRITETEREKMAAAVARFDPIYDHRLRLGRDQASRRAKADPVIPIRPAR